MASAVSDYNKAKALVDYNKAYAEARAKALPVLNSEILKGIGYLELKNNGDDYDWPGHMLVDKCWAPTGYVLSLPSAKDESKMRTAEEIAEIWINGLAPCCNAEENKRRLTNDLKEYANQQLAAFKERLKNAINKVDRLTGDGAVYEIRQIIDQL
jgi:hypothetical protein